jgi:hypothetical protein
MIYELGEIIATRKLSFIDDDGSERIVEVNLGNPKQFPDSSDFYVPFQVIGAGSETVLCAGGIDAFQALQEVMIIIGAKLSVLNESCGGRLRWEAEEGSSLGFPDPTTHD